MAANRPLTLDEVIEELGGAQAIQEQSDTFKQVVAYFYANESFFIEEHPYKWIAVTKDRVVAIGDSMESVFDEAGQKGFFNPDVLVRFLDPDPPALIL